MNQASACTSDQEAATTWQRPLLRAVDVPADFEYPVPAEWRGKYGVALPGEILRLRFVGNPAGPKLLVLGGISANRFVADETPSQKGWWREVVTSHGFIDLEKCCVIGTDYPPYGLDREVDLCPEDLAFLLRAALQAAGIEHLAAFIGASFGGMIGLAYARLFPESLDQLAVVCAAHKPDPMAQGWRLIQRRTIEFARDAGCPEEGIALARQLAMTTYRSPEEFTGRFDTDLASPENIGHYLTAQGQSYADKTDPVRYLTLSSAIDRHFEDPEDITVPALFLGALSDRLVPLADIAELQRRYAGPSELISISSVYGHDAFLKETRTIGRHLKQFLQERLS